jgi:hypothetical protein
MKSCDQQVVGKWRESYFLGAILEAAICVW